MTSVTLDWLAIVAGMLTAISFVAQALRIARTRSAHDLSWAMLFAFAGGTALWIVWGIQQHALVIVVTNAVTMLLALVILVLKWRLARADPLRRVRIRNGRDLDDPLLGARTRGPSTLTNF